MSCRAISRESAGRCPWEWSSRAQQNPLDSGLRPAQVRMLGEPAAGGRTRHPRLPAHRLPRDQGPCSRRRLPPRAHPRVPGTTLVRNAPRTASARLPHQVLAPPRSRPPRPVDSGRRHGQRRRLPGNQPRRRPIRGNNSDLPVAQQPGPGPVHQGAAGHGGGPGPRQRPYQLPVAARSAPELVANPGTWHEITTSLPPVPGPVRPSLDDRKRQEASAFIWARITGGEPLFAPRPIEAASPTTSAGPGSCAAAVHGFNSGVLTRSTTMQPCGRA